MSSSIPGDQDLADKINRAADDINRLEKFTRFNYTGFLKIVKKHDRHTNYILRPMFMVRLNQCPFWKDVEDNDALLIKLSSLFSQVRGSHPGQSMSFQPSTSLMRESVLAGQNKNTTRTVLKRFVVHTDDILELKTTILRHLPVLVYRNTKGAQQQDDIDPPISTLYLDNQDLDSYCSRVEFKPASQIIRLRWYGSAKGNKSISVERRTLEDENRGELKDKFTIKDKYVDGFLHGDRLFLDKYKRKMQNNGSSPEDIQTFEDLFTSIQKQIMENKMAPVLRTYYKRTAFQIPGDRTVRMALDTDLCFIREDKQKEDEWCRSDVTTDFPFRSLQEGVDINRYPYATFEIKLALGPQESEPRWIVDLEQSGLLEEANQFSKFVHGMAVLFDTRVPLLPYWLAQLDETPKLILEEERPPIMKRPTQQSAYGSIALSMEPEASTSNTTTTEPHWIWENFKKSIMPKDDQQEEEHLQLPPGVKIPKKVKTPIKVEPKVFFANERTYFSWMRFGTVLSTFSLALFNSGDAVGKISAILYTLIAVSVLMYGAGLYYRRRELIRERLPGPYDELVGPTVICFALLFAVGLNAYLKFTNTHSSNLYF